MKYSGDELGVRALANSPGMSAAMVQAAQKGLAMAQASAPRRSGEFAGNFSVKAVDVTAGRKNETRAGAVIENDTPYAAYVHKRGESNFMHSIVPFIEGGS